MKFLLAVLAGCILFIMQNAAADEHLDEFTSALVGGKIKANIQYRYEGVDDDANDLDSAKASTIRTRLGYATGNFHGFSLYGEFEDIREVGSKKYNDGPGPLDDADLEYDTVADPQETELNQAYLQYSNTSDNLNYLFRYGRQLQRWDNDRFIGNVVWRQNHQTYDALLLQAESKKYGLRAMYSRQTNVNRIFGDQAGTAGDFNVTNDNFNINYSGLKHINASAYYYLWESDEPETNPGGFGEDDSRKTMGLRVTGNYPFSDSVTFLGSGEYASQSDYKEADDFSSLDYILIEAGLKFNTGLKNVSPITIKAGMETLEGSVDDGESFITPFATLFKFQGFADVFLGAGITGVYGAAGTAGIEDSYLTLTTSLYGTGIYISYHDFEPDDSASVVNDYGTEINIRAVKKFAKHYSLGALYADFNGDDDFRDDKQIFTVFASVNF